MILWQNIKKMNSDEKGVPCLQIVVKIIFFRFWNVDSVMLHTFTRGSYYIYWAL